MCRGSVWWQMHKLMSLLKLNLKNQLRNNKIVLTNFSYLTILQFFILLFPFITYPYLLRVLGFDVYGKVIFAQTIATNIAILINFGFNVSGTNNIACNRKNISKLSQIVSSIYSIKFVIWLICLLIYFILIHVIPFLQTDRWLYMIAFFVTFNDLLFPIWFFQGIEKMKYITFINISVRSLFVVFIFFLVKNQSDYHIVPLLNAIGALLGGVIALYVVIKKEKVCLQKQSLVTLKYFFKDSLPLFVSSVSVQIYVNVHKLLVGSFLGMKEVAIYDMGEKISGIIKIPIGMFVQATFPKISREKNISFVNKVMWISAGLISIFYLGIFVFADYIVQLLSGEHNLTAVSIVRILSFSAILIVFNYFLGGNRLIPFGYRKDFMKNAVYNCIFLLGCFLILYLFNAVSIYSIACLTIVAEVFVLFLNYYKCYKHNLLWVQK
jgi:PST family polysaccharide transporter